MSTPHIAVPSPRRNNKIDPGCINCASYTDKLWAEIDRLRLVEAESRQQAKEIAVLRRRIERLKVRAGI